MVPESGVGPIVSSGGRDEVVSIGLVYGAVIACDNAFDVSVDVDSG